MPPIAMTVAGSDPSGGAGLQADLKTFHQHGVYGTSVVTLLTVQNTIGVEQVQTCTPKFVRAQLEAVIGDLPPAVAKTGALGDAAIVEVVAEFASTSAFPWVVDPVMVSKHGQPLIDADAIHALRAYLLPVATVLTPNLHEAAILADVPIHTLHDAQDAARRIADLGPRHVLIKGGGSADVVDDVLWSQGEITCLNTERVSTPHTHGSGCVFSAAITANLALGQAPVPAIHHAKQFITAAIRTAPGLGHGRGPVNMFSRPTC